MTKTWNEVRAVEGRFYHRRYSCRTTMPPVSETARLRMSYRVVEDSWPLRRPVERLPVSVTIAARWPVVDLEYWLYDAIGLWGMRRRCGARSR